MLYDESGLGKCNLSWVAVFIDYLVTDSVVSVVLDFSLCLSCAGSQSTEFVSVLIKNNGSIA